MGLEKVVGVEGGGGRNGGSEAKRTSASSPSPPFRLELALEELPFSNGVGTFSSGAGESVDVPLSAASANMPVYLTYSQ